MTVLLSLRWVILSNKILVQAGRSFLCRFYKLDLYSIGWYYTTDVLAADLEKMIEEADIAMYRAKGSELLTNHSL